MYEKETQNTYRNRRDNRGIGDTVNHHHQQRYRFT
jgi:hypothetical protein